MYHAGCWPPGWKQVTPLCLPVVAASIMPNLALLILVVVIFTSIVSWVGKAVLQELVRSPSLHPDFSATADTTPIGILDVFPYISLVDR